MQRDILDKLIQWKTKPNRKPLIIQGARQVGKIWAMKHFGEQAFEQVAYSNFDNNPRIKTPCSFILCRQVHYLAFPCIIRCLSLWARWIFTALSDDFSRIFDRTWAI